MLESPDSSGFEMLQQLLGLNTTFRATLLIFDERFQSGMIRTSLDHPASTIYLTDHEHQMTFSIILNFIPNTELCTKPEILLFSLVLHLSNHQIDKCPVKCGIVCQIIPHCRIETIEAGSLEFGTGNIDWLSLGLLLGLLERGKLMNLCGQLISQSKQGINGDGSLDGFGSHGSG